MGLKEQEDIIVTQQMSLKRVTGNNKQTQRLADVPVVGALKGTNQSNPRSGGTTLVSVQPKEKKEPTGNQQNLVVSGQTSGTSTQPKSTGKGSGIQQLNKGGFREKRVYGDKGISLALAVKGDTIPQIQTGTNPQSSTKGTLEQLTLLSYRNTTSSVRDFLANLSLLLGSEEDLKILEAHSSLKLCESLGLKEHRIYYLRMSRDSSPMMRGIHSKPSLERWMNLGMTVNGRCLTAKTTESPRTGKGCSLSDILEDNPDLKYFLSEKQVKSLTAGMQESTLLQHSKHQDKPVETTEE